MSKQDWVWVAILIACLAVVSYVIPSHSQPQEMKVSCQTLPTELRHEDGDGWSRTVTGVYDGCQGIVSAPEEFLPDMDEVKAKRVESHVVLIFRYRVGHEFETEVIHFNRAVGTDGLSRRLKDISTVEVRKGAKSVVVSVE